MENDDDTTVLLTGILNASPSSFMAPLMNLSSVISKLFLVPSSPASIIWTKPTTQFSSKPNINPERERERERPLRTVGCWERKESSLKEGSWKRWKTELMHPAEAVVVSFWASPPPPPSAALFEDPAPPQLSHSFAISSGRREENSFQRRRNENENDSCSSS